MNFLYPILSATFFIAAIPVRPDDAEQGIAAYLQCVRREGITLVTAHRGGVAGGLAENSLEAAKHTIAHIPALLELDVQRTRDGVLMLMHDAKIDRTTNGTGNIQSLDWDQVKDLRLRNYAGLVTPSRIPRLDEVLDWARGRAVVQLDVKRGVPVEQVARRVLASGAQGYATIIVYNLDDARKVAAVSPALVMNVNISSSGDLQRLEAAGITSSRIIAFTGNKGTPRALWDLLESKDVHIGFGTIWDEDLRIATTGEEGRYAALGGMGVDLIVTDRHFEAFRAVEKPDTRARIAACERKAGIVPVTP